MLVRRGSKILSTALGFRRLLSPSHTCLDYKKQQLLSFWNYQCYPVIAVSLEYMIIIMPSTKMSPHEVLLLNDNSCCAVTQPKNHQSLIQPTEIILL